MNKWQVLRIEPTKDKRAIKKAYGAMLKEYHPEENPVEFMIIQKAYKAALREASSDSFVMDNFDLSASIFTMENTGEEGEKPFEKERSHVSDGGERIEEKRNIDFDKVIAEGKESAKYTLEEDIRFQMDTLKSCRKLSDFREALERSPFWENVEYIESLKALLAEKWLSSKKLICIRETLLSYAMATPVGDLFDKEKEVLKAIHFKLVRQTKLRKMGITILIIGVAILAFASRQMELKNMQEVENPAYIESRLEERYGEDFTVMQIEDARVQLPGSSEFQKVDHYRCTTEDNPHIKTFEAWKEKVSRTSDKTRHEVYSDYLKQVVIYACEQEGIEITFSGSMGLYEWEPPGLVLSTDMTIEAYVNKLETLYHRIGILLPENSGTLYIYMDNSGFQRVASFEYGSSEGYDFDREGIIKVIEEYKGSLEYDVYNVINSQ